MPWLKYPVRYSAAIAGIGIRHEIRIQEVPALSARKQLFQNSERVKGHSPEQASRAKLLLEKNFGRFQQPQPP